MEGVHCHWYPFYNHLLRKKFVHCTFLLVFPQNRVPYFKCGNYQSTVNIFDIKVILLLKIYACTSFISEDFLLPHF